MFYMTLLMCSSCSEKNNATSGDAASIDSLLCPKYATGSNAGLIRQV